VQLQAIWDVPIDLDLALIDEQGRRFSWLGGGKTLVSAADVASTQDESIAFAKLPPGRYVVEVTRAATTEPLGRVRGDLSAHVVENTSATRFVLEGARAEVGIVEIRNEARLEPLPGSRPTLQLAASDIERVVQSHRPFVKRQCWEPAFAAKPQGAPSSARVIVVLNVMPDGHVGIANASGGDAFPSLAGCVQSIVRNWRFPPSRGASLKIPFVFTAP
jgi:hypothetical protein